MKRSSCWERRSSVWNSKTLMKIKLVYRYRASVGRRRVRGALCRGSTARVRGTRGAGAASPFFSLFCELVGRGRRCRAPGEPFARQLWTVTVLGEWIVTGKCVSDCGAQQLGCSDRITTIWIAVFLLGFWHFVPPSKLGMHKMELGDSVYAAERIMKKRIRKVSLLLLRERTQYMPGCKTIRDHILASPA